MLYLSEKMPTYLVLIWNFFKIRAKYQLIKSKIRALGGLFLQGAPSSHSLDQIYRYFFPSTRFVANFFMLSTRYDTLVFSTGSYSYKFWTEQRQQCKISDIEPLDTSRIFSRFFEIFFNKNAIKSLMYDKTKTNYGADGAAKYFHPFIYRPSHCLPTNISNPPPLNRLENGFKGSNSIDPIRTRSENGN